VVGHFSTGTILSNNTITGAGGVEGFADGGIEIDATEGIQISNNTITNAVRAGITVYSHNINMNVSGNTIVAPWALTGCASGICVVEDGNTGVFTSNVLQAGSTPVGSVTCTEVIYVEDYAGNQIGIGSKNSAPASVAVVTDPGAHTYVVAES
jgi:hypothetical protein